MVTKSLRSTLIPRATHKLALAAATISLLVTAQARAVAPFTIAVLPDTQYYSQNNTTNPGSSLFHDQVDWVLANRVQQNIVFVSQLGDVVNVAGGAGQPTAQWPVALDAMQSLKQSSLPFNILPGNHDWTSAAGTGSIEHYRSRFGDQADYFAGKSWFMGYDERGVNTAVKFDTPAGPMINISLEFNASSPTAIPGAPASPMAWAQSILDNNKGVPTIISTHNSINPGKGRDGFGNALFKELVRENNQVFLVLNGHYVGNDNEQDLTSLNSYGRPVFEMGTDYQTNANGGDGWMRLIHIDPDAKRLRVETYSPKNNADLSGDLGGAAGVKYANTGTVRTDYDSKFERELDLTKRFAPTAAPVATQSRTFQHGASGYAGGADTEIDQLTPATVLSTATIIDVDGDTTDGNVSQALVKFDGVFGSASGQVPADRDVMRATLRVYVDASVSNSQGSGLLAHRMLVPWENGSTWASVADGVAADGIKAAAVEDDSAGANNGADNVKAGTWIELDVTRSLRAMQNGAANQGWALLPWEGSANAIRFNSNESATVARRPQLQIDVTSAAVVAKSFRNGVGGYAGAVNTTVDGNTPTVERGTDPIIRVDAGGDDYTTPDTQALLRFDSVIGTGSGQVPIEDVRVTSATLKLSVPAGVEFANGGGFSVNRMRRAWNWQSTWNSLVNGVAINEDATSIPDDVQGIDGAGSPLEPGMLYVDVTSSLQAWTEAGESNLGWALLPLPKATNAVFMNGVQSALELRPELVVRYLSLGPATWAKPGSGEWLATSNWQGGNVPDAVGRTTVFGAGNTAPAIISLSALQTVGTLRFDSPNGYTIAGDAPLLLQRALGRSARVEVLRGTHVVAAPLLLATSAEIDVAADTLLEIATTLQAAPAVSLTKRGAGQLSVRGLDVASLNVEAGDFKVLAGAVSVAEAVKISAPAHLVLASDATLVVDYSGTATSPIQSIRSAILDGRLVPSLPQAGLTVGYAEAAALPSTTAIGGVTLDATSLIIRSALSGDTNLDGSVNFDDLLALARRYGAAGSWTDGDSTHDARVDFDDLLALARNYGSKAAPFEATATDPNVVIDWALAQSLVPEPAAVATLAPLLLMGARTRSK